MPDLGTKYECAECGAKFYDLGKPEPICPKCGTDQRQHQEKRPEPKARYVAPPKPAAADDEIDEEISTDIVVEEDEEILVEPAEAEDEEEDDDD